MSSPIPQPSPIRDFIDFLEHHRQRIEPLEIEMGHAWWASNTNGTSEAEERSANIEKRLTRIYADRETFTWLRELDTTDFPPDLARQHKLLLDMYTGNQMDDATIEEIVDTSKEIESIYNNYRATFHGQRVTDNHLREALRNTNDPDSRREAWEAGKRIGREVENRILRLVVLRNREAQKLGYRDYYAMSLALQELDEARLLAILDEVDRYTEPLWREYKDDLDRKLARRFHTTVEELRPWHYPDPFFQEAPPGDVNLDDFFRGKNLEALTQTFFEDIGLPVQDILARSDLYEREGKSQHGFCLHIGRYEDVRVLCNCVPSERWMSTMLHEFGHAVYDRFLGEDLPFFLRDTAHILVTEAIAMLMGRCSRSAPWLERYVDVPAHEANRVARSAGAEMGAQILIIARWCLVMTHFERALYADPAQDLNRLWWDTVRRYQWITPPEGRDEPDWAAKLHLALAPVYYHNYLFGEMLASQLLDCLSTNANREGYDALVARPSAGTWLREAIFARGASLPWDQLIEEATGEPLNPMHFVRQITPSPD